MTRRVLSEEERLEIVDRILLGESAVMREVKSRIVRLASTDLSVLIEGPTGVGKELAAEALHSASGRKGLFVAVNAAAIPESMFEDAVFGHVPGAFTGAVGAVDGFLAEADGGTVFFDEIGCLSVATQAKLLRAVETKRFRPVGARADRASNFRLIAATNEPLAGLLQRGHFRADLLYRLSGATIPLPPLSAHREDIAVLARSFAERLRIGEGPALQLDESAFRALEHRDWPGNVRELRTAIERLAIFSDGQVIAERDVRAACAGEQACRSAASALSDQRAQLLAVLESHDWSVSRCAAALGKHRVTLSRLMRRLGISVPSPTARALLRARSDEQRDLLSRRGSDR